MELDNLINKFKSKLTIKSCCMTAFILFVIFIIAIIWYSNFKSDYNKKWMADSIERCASLRDKIFESNIINDTFEESKYSADNAYEDCMKSAESAKW